MIDIAIVKELLNYMVEEEDDIIKEITEKTCNIIEVNAPSRRWQIDQIIKVLALAGKYINDESICCLLQLIAATPEIQAYSVTKMFSALEQNMMQDALAKVTLWCVGEFGQLLRNREVEIQTSSVISAMNTLIEQNCNKGVKSYILNCCIKLYSRFDGQISDMIPILQKLLRDSDADIQQRSFEYLNIIRSTRLTMEQKKSLLEEIPISRISANMFNSKPVDVGGEVKATSTQGPVSLGLSNLTPATGSSVPIKPVSSNDDFLNILGDDIVPVQTAPVQPVQPTQAPPAGGFIDLMGGDFDLVGGSISFTLR